MKTKSFESVWNRHRRTTTIVGTAGSRRESKIGAHIVKYIGGCKTMSKTQTRTAPTAHGSVEYETVTCDSCGTEIAKSEAYKFAIWESGDVETFVKDAHTTGWACEFCRDKPIQFPRVERLSGYMGAFYRAMLADPDVDSVLRISAILYIWVSAVFILSFILAAVGA